MSSLLTGFVRPWKEVPSQCLNLTLLVSVWTFGIMGAMGGMDDGTISGIITLPSYDGRFHLSTKYHSATGLANIKGNIISLAQIGAAIGSVFTFLVLEKLGRLWALRLGCAINLVGSIIQITASSSLGQIYVGRLLLGVAYGVSGVACPTYLAEIAPKAIRGACGICYGGSYYIGLVVGYFANYGASVHLPRTSDIQWRMPLALTFTFPLITLISSLGAVESPRWLMKTKKGTRALSTLQRLRGVSADHPLVLTEAQGIEAQLEREREATEAHGALALVKEMFGVGSMRYRLLLALGTGLFGQWGGGGAFTAYAPELFALLGVTGNTGLFTTGIYGIVKLLVSLVCAFFILDRLGRKQALFGGISLQVVAATYIAVFLATTGDVPAADQTSAQKAAAHGAIGMIFVQGVSWALGWNAVQHPINAEIFPLRVRALGTSLSVCFRTLMNYGANKALPIMLIGIKGTGTFFFFAAEGILAIIFVWIFLPDTKGRELEELDALFELPWYKIGRSGRRIADEQALGLNVYQAEGRQGQEMRGEVGVGDKKSSETLVESV